MQTKDSEISWNDIGDITAKKQRIIPEDGYDITDYTWILKEIQSHEKQKNAKSAALYKADFIFIHWFFQSFILLFCC